MKMVAQLVSQLMSIFIVLTIAIKKLYFFVSNEIVIHLQLKPSERFLIFHYYRELSNVICNVNIIHFIFKDLRSYAGRNVNTLFRY